MTVPSSTPTPAPAPVESPPTSLIYRPLSGPAVASFVLALLYAGVITLMAVTAMREGGAFFLPDWSILIPIIGAVTAFLGIRQIRNSEGTRAGMALARVGLWLNVFIGVGYSAYHYFTGLALAQQTQSFLLIKDVDSGFFPRIFEARTNADALDQAFLLTLPANNRPRDLKELMLVYGTNAREGQRYNMFQSDFFTATMARGGDACKVELLGIQSWKFESHCYQMVRDIRVVTPEASLQFQLPLQSTEGSERKWFVVLPPLNLKVDYTPLGNALQNHGMLAFFFMEKQIGQVNSGHGIGGIKDLTDWTRISKDLPHQDIHDYFATMFKDPVFGKDGVINYLEFKMKPERYINPWKVVDGHTRFEFPFSVRFRGFKTMPLMGDGYFIVRDQDPVKLGPDNLPDPNSLSTNPRWELVGMDFRRILPMGGPQKTN
jgi:hypothetical protein